MDGLAGSYCQKLESISIPNQDNFGPGGFQTRHGVLAGFGGSGDDRHGDDIWPDLSLFDGFQTPKVDQ